MNSIKRMGLGLVIGIVALMRGEASAQSIKLATLAPSGTSMHKSLLKMGSAWQKSGVKLTVYADGTMGGESQMVRRMRINQVQAALLTAQGLSTIDQSVKSLQLVPMMFRDLNEFDYVQKRIAPVIAEKFRKKGYEILFWSDLGYVHFFTTKPARRIDDFRPMKMYVWSGDTPTQNLLKTLGLIGVSLEQTDVLTGLQTGLIDQISTVPIVALSGQFYRTANNMLALNWNPLVGALVVSSRTWDRIPSAKRKALLDAATIAGNEIRAFGRAESDGAIEAMKKRGLNVITPSPEDIEDWEKFAEKIYPEVRGKIMPADMFDKLRGFGAEYRARGGK